jgi:hypothetical protein
MRETLNKQIESAAFKRWFQGSYLANDQGQPITLFHGTRPGVEFNVFDQPDHDGTYFTPNPLYAAGFTNEIFGNGDAVAGSIVPVYLSIKKPFVVTADPDDEEWEAFCYRGLDRKNLVAQGYDGAVLVERSTGIIDQVQAYYPEQVKSAIGNAGTFDPTTPDIRYARTDPRYMFAGPQSETSDLRLFDEARQLEQKKIDKRAIWEQTGWMRGVDGKWRYEINDADASLKIGLPDWLTSEVGKRVDQEASVSVQRGLFRAVINEGKPNHLATHGHTPQDAIANLKIHLAREEFQGIETIDRMGSSFFELHHLLDHPRLFAAYPRLKEMSVQFDRGLPDRVGGSFSHDTGISLNPRQDHGEILNILLHEIQHALQDTEGFAYGGMPEKAFTDGLKERLSELSDAQRRQVDRWAVHHIDKLTSEQDALDMITYGLMYQSMERLMAYANRDKPSGVLRLIRSETSWTYHPMVRDSDVARDFDDFDRNWYALPKRHNLRARNLFLRDHCAEAARLLGEVIPPAVRQTFRNDDRQLKSILKSLERSAAQARERTAPHRELTREQKTAEQLQRKHRFSTPYEIYRSLAGEIESRNTEVRRDMTEVERRATLPSQTADISDDDAIVIFRRRNSYEVGLPYRSASASDMHSTRATHSTALGLDKSHAEYICDQLMASWAGKPSIHVVDRLAELPGELQSDIAKKRATETVQGAFYNNAVYLVAPRLPDRDALEEILLHEVVGHYGLRKVLGDGFQSTLESVYVAMADTDIGRYIQKSYFPQNDFDVADSEHRQLVAEEIMAHLAESGEYRELADSRKYDSEIRAGLRHLGFELPLTHPDILALLKGAEAVVKSGGLAVPGQASTCFRRAYHGSPYQFDRFSLGAIGAGEGAQICGWGLYFAGQPAVAEWYKSVLETSRVSVNGVEIPNILGGHIDRDALTSAIKKATGASDRDAHRMGVLFNIGNTPFSNDAILARLDKSISDYREFGSHDAARVMETLRPFVEMLAVEPVRGGHIYEVEIPDDNDLLDYDVLISDQSVEVREKLAVITEYLLGKPITDQMSEKLTSGSITGEAYYNLLVGEMAIEHNASLLIDAPRLASEALGAEGVPGLRYLDSDSRISAADGATHNYVIWDEYVVSIQAVNNQVVQANTVLLDAGAKSVALPDIAPRIFQALGALDTFVPSLPVEKVAELYEKTMFVYRVAAAGQLSQFDGVARSQSDLLQLTTFWEHTHAAHFQKHDDCAHALNVSRSTLAARYREDLASYGLLVTGDHLQGVSAICMEVPTLLEAVGRGAGIAAHTAQRAMQAWHGREAPFGGNPADSKAKEHWSARARQGAVEGLRFAKDHCPAPSVALWSALALTRQALTHASGNLPLDSDIETAIRVGLPVVTSLSAGHAHADSAPKGVGEQCDDLLIERHPFMRGVIADALTEVCSDAEAFEAFSAVLAQSDAGSQSSLRKYLLDAGYSNLIADTWSPALYGESHDIEMSEGFAMR